MSSLVPLAATVFAGTLLTAAGCAQPIDGLWPPRPGESTHRVIVSTDAWHSVIGLPAAAGADLPLDEWAYADKAYYLEGDDGFCGTLGALFVPSVGVVYAMPCRQPWAERSPQPPGRTWEFDLTDEGYARLVAAMHADVASPEPISRRGGAQWMDARSSYHVFHHCHHWTADALREAGLPVWSVYSLFKWSLEAQLDRAARLATIPDGDEP